MSILCIGDSLTRGQVGYSYLPFLKTQAKYKNAGKSGDTILCMTDRLKEILEGKQSADIDTVIVGIGTNDLTQYTLAMDRQNPLLQKKYDDHHPAILKMIKMIVDAGHAQNCKVCLCGELAADTRLTETFLQMGVDALSVVPACILPVRKALRAVCIAEM